MQARVTRTTASVSSAIMASGTVSVLLLLVICMAILLFDSLQNPMDRLPRRLEHPGVPARRPLSIRYPPEPIETPLEQRSGQLLRIEANWSRRKIFLPRKSVEALRRHRERQAKEKEALVHHQDRFRLTG
jgi:hypothetical protein